MGWVEEMLKRPPGKFVRVCEEDAVGGANAEEATRYICACV